jgi:xylan 1,4-beta-xylosidase
MFKLKLKTVILLSSVTLITSSSWNTISGQANKSTASKTFAVQISDKPMTFCNPLNLSVGSERARRAGEPVIVLYQNDYYLFITGGRGYWYSANMRDWTYVDVPSFPRGCPSVLTDGETLYACSMNARDVFTSTGLRRC